ncbi:hypothetical protein BKA61DRAFT_693425 [Leptodontidium sp. MPI-SDFR-AT-0119]|nr:hypothetical protein BKA61DRAFT_693425 [Leptodontidium sp. MPI-SDFR-AT-0119]
MEVGIRLRDCEKIPMTTTPPIQDNAPTTSTSVSNKHRAAQHRGLEPPSEPGSYPRRFLIEDGDDMEGDGGQDECPQQTFTLLSAKPAGEAVPSSAAGGHTQSLGSASTTERIARNKPLLGKLRKFVFQGFYLNCTVRPVGGAQPDEDAILDAVIKILKKEQEPETEARSIVKLSDRLACELLPKPHLRCRLPPSDLRTTDKKCYFEGCKRKKQITTSNQQHKHYLTHYPKKAALCPFIDRDGSVYSRVFDSENLLDHLRKTHNIDWSIPEFSKFRNEYLNPRLLISIPDRFHPACLFCSETFTDAKSSRDHSLRHEKTETVEALDQAYLEYGAKCSNHRLCGTEKYWKSSEYIQRAIRAPRPLPWPPMILSGTETGGTASQPSDHFLAGTTSGYGHTMRDGSYGTPFTSSNGSSYYHNRALRATKHHTTSSLDRTTKISPRLSMHQLLLLGCRWNDGDARLYETNRGTILLMLLSSKNPRGMR